MYERIIEIIMFFVAQLHKNKSINDGTFEELSNQGYSASEISTAFSWLVDKTEFGEGAFESDTVPGGGSFRIFHEAEQAFLSQESQGYLIQLRELNLLSNEHLEMVLDRCLRSADGKLGEANLKSIVASILFDTDAMNSTGSRVLLNGTDTIH